MTRPVRSGVGAMVRSSTLSLSLSLSLSLQVSKFGNHLKVKYKHKLFYTSKLDILRSTEIIFHLTEFSG